MELRVIVWETMDCVYKDFEECNDLYARGGIANKVK